MLTLVIGGAASGKSAYAESLVLKTGLPRYYLATMQVWDAECAARVAKHRAMRAEKQFETLECPLHLDHLALPGRGTVLLEDLGNLVANELYDPGGAGEHTAKAVLTGLERLAAGSRGKRGQSHPARAGKPCSPVRKPHRSFQRGVQRRGRLCRRYRAVSAGAGAGKQRLRRPGGQRLPGGLRPAGVLQGGREAVTILQTIAVAFAMFSALPVPQFGWNEKNMRYAMCAFPLIGLVCGGLWCLCGVLPLPDMARAAAFCLVPVAVTGGIHLDGYADTSDALSSYGDREKKLEILKDSHCGAFAVIRLCSYFVAYFGLCGSVQFTPRVGLCWTLALVLERALSGFAVAAFPLAKDTGLAHTFATAADRQTVRRFLCGASALLVLALTVLGGGALAAAALLSMSRYYFVAKKQFGGITGDLAGWFLQRAELWMLAALAVSQWGGVL